MMKPTQRDSIRNIILINITGDGYLSYCERNSRTVDLDVKKSLYGSEKEKETFKCKYNFYIEKYNLGISSNNANNANENNVNDHNYIIESDDAKEQFFEQIQSESGRLKILLAYMHINLSKTERSLWKSIGMANSISIFLTSGKVDRSCLKRSTDINRLIQDGSLKLVNDKWVLVSE